MKKIFLFIIFVIVYFTGFSQGIRFEENLLIESVLTKAKSENKFVFIDFYTPWCAPCKKMSKQVFPQKTVGDFFNEHFVSLSLNGDAVENKSLVEKYVIISYPAFIFLNSQGEVIHRALDEMSEEKFIQLGENAIDFKNNFKSIADKIKNGDRTPETLEKYFGFIPFSDEKEKLSIEYLNKLTNPEKLSDTAWVFFRDYIQDVKCAPFLYFAKNTKLFINRFGKEKVEKKMVNLFQNSYKDNNSYFKSLKKYNPKFYNEVELKLKNTNS